MSKFVNGATVPVGVMPAEDGAASLIGLTVVADDMDVSGARADRFYVRASHALMVSKTLARVAREYGAKEEEGA